MTKYQYLLDKDFLTSLDLETIKTLYARVTILDINDRPIRAIEGKTTGGSLSINGTSAIRRTGSLTLIADSSYYNITDVSNLISINKRVEIEIGIKNSFFFSNSYPEYDIFWFPLGVFLIAGASIAHNNTGVNINLTLKDKMSLLNGENGGVLSSAVIHSPLSVGTDENTGLSVTEPAKIRDIIYTLVAEFGEI